MRSFLFAPANRPDLAGKFPQISAECSILDLEDGTPLAETEAARRLLASTVAELRAGPYSGFLYVRVNAPLTPQYPDDVTTSAQLDIDGIVIPKLESVAQLEKAEALVRESKNSRFSIIGGIETMRGVRDVELLAAAGGLMNALYFGSEDFANDAGMRRTDEGKELWYARSKVALAAKAAGFVALDQGVPDICNDAKFRRDSEEGRSLGYDGKICVLPRQVEIANEVFAPDPKGVEKAGRLVAAYRDAVARGVGTIDFEGQVVDGPIFKRAETLLLVAQEYEAKKSKTTKRGAA